MGEFSPPEMSAAGRITQRILDDLDAA